VRKVKINNHVFAVGIQWDAGSRDSLTLAALHKKALEIDQSMDMVAFRGRQFGFASSEGKPREWLRIRSLAASVTINARSFLGLFCLCDEQGEFWWLCAFSQGVLVGMGDQVFSDRQSAEEWLLSLRGLLANDFEQKITCETVEESFSWLEPFIKHKIFGRISSRKNGYLQSLTPVPGQKKSIFLFFASISAFIILLIAFFQYTKYTSEQKERFIIESRKKEIELRRKELLNHPEKHFGLPWLSRPAIQDHFLHGIKLILSQPLVASGWELIRVEYTDNIIISTWNYKPGANFLLLPSNGKLVAPNKAISKIKTETLIKKQTSKKLFNKELCSMLLYQGTQLLGAHLKINFKPPEIKNIEGIEISSPWAKGKWELSNLPPALIKDGVIPNVIASIPGVVLDSIIYDKTNWTIKGTIYVDSKY
jgi:hypothetical protein